MRKGLRVIVAAVLLAAGCGGGGTGVEASPLPGSPNVPGGEAPPDLDPETIAAGAELYARFCVACHGADLAGDPDWRNPNEDGSYPPPPHDSSGHTWHHGDDLLVEIVLEGLDFPQSRMPAFGDQLTRQEVLSILEFFKSNWGPRERAVQWEVTLRERAQS